MVPCLSVQTNNTALCEKSTLPWQRECIPKPTTQSNNHSPTLWGSLWSTGITTHTHTHTGKALLFQLSARMALIVLIISLPPCGPILPHPPPAHSSLLLIKAEVAPSPFVKPPSPTLLAPFPLPPPSPSSHQPSPLSLHVKASIYRYNGRKGGQKQREGNKK